MVGVTTVALIERKPGISRDLFTRYWRDVHGVMAARIPGFESYTQYHVAPLNPAGEPFEGIAIVTFASEADRDGLATSPIAHHIHRDEVNVFRRALLYNLAAGADPRLRDGAYRAEGFFVVPIGVDVSAVIGRLATAGAAMITSYDLRTGDPAGWNDTDVDDGGQGRRFGALIHAGWDADSVPSEVPTAAIAVGALAFGLDETHRMVAHGRATAVGLRGFDAVRTIREAGADNQLTPEVERDLYGVGQA